MNDNDVRRAISVARADAEEAIRSMPSPDVDRLVELATSDRVERAPHGRHAGRPRSRLLPFSAAAAALIVVVAGLALIVPSDDSDQSEPSPQILALVESLYTEGSYVIDEIAPRLAAESQPGYLDGVWDGVLDEVEQSEED